jgi:hypothetical protein
MSIRYKSAAHEAGLDDTGKVFESAFKKMVTPPRQNEITRILRCSRLRGLTAIGP